MRGPQVAHVDRTERWNIHIPLSRDTVQQYGISHVLSVVDAKDKPVLDEGLVIQHLLCEIDDNPYEDLLMVLDGLCAWIDDALRIPPEKGVFVHCV